MLPIAEVFTSIHGEGYWAGTPMTFIRLAGCTVGKSFIKHPAEKTSFPMFPDGKYNFVCTTFDGREFPCDTDYRKTAELSIEKVLSLIPSYIRHVCITGGEPLMHGEKLEVLVSNLLRDNKYTIHFETSGTIDPPNWMKSEHKIWWACSPKKDYLPLFVKLHADEIRVMVDPDLKIEDVRRLLESVDPSTPVFFCPISSTDNVLGFDGGSMASARDFTTIFPGSRISIQMHKVLGVR